MIETPDETPNDDLEFVTNSPFVDEEKKRPPCPPMSPCLTDKTPRRYNADPFISYDFLLDCQTFCMSEDRKWTLKEMVLGVIRIWINEATRTVQIDRCDDDGRWECADLYVR